MKHTFRYIVLAAVLLSPTLSRAQTAGAPPIYGEGYKIEGGVATRKSVSSTMDSNGYYTLKLETFATGVTSITQKAVPSDIILVLDLSTSMGGHRNGVAKLQGSTTVSINDVELEKAPKPGDSSTTGTYGMWRDEAVQQFAYQISTLVLDNRCYLYCVTHSHVWFIKKDGTATQTNFSYASLQNGDTFPLSDRPQDGYPYSVANTATGRSERAWTFSPLSTGTNIVNNGENELFQDEIVWIGSSRIHELKNAVSEFIDAVVDNNFYKTVNGQKVLRDNPLGNKLAIVSWANYLLNSNIYGDQTTDLLSLNNSANVTALKEIAENFTLYDGTKPHLGINEANRLFGLAANARTGELGKDYLRTIVFFTDGQPDVMDGYDSKFDPAIISAKTSKTSVGANVYSVGLFSLAEGQTVVPQDTQNFMNYVSSNYPEAETYANHGDPDAEGNYYKDVSTGNLTLSDVFKTIAQASGGSEKTIPGATQVVDGVTNSFTIPTPQGATAPTIASAQVRVYTQSINIAGTAWTTDTPDLTLIEMSDDECESPDMTKSYMTDEDKVGVAVKNGRLIVMGFNYSKADTDDTSLDGNWVGWRYPRQVQTCAGKELVIEFKIKGDPSATGGDDTQTNTGDSGIFIPQYDATGNFIGYEPVNQYNVPIADIPINLVIKKVGMRHGESATIQIYRAPVSDKYNTTTGKLQPDLTNGWSNFSKVILTNWGADGDVVTETLLCLDPKYVYKLEEDNWGWAYELDDKSIDTSEQEKNPFVFTNTEKTDAVKHAEAATLNRFGNELHGRERKQTVKSSKTKTFISTPATGE